jgi:hypothetical protein
MCGRYGASVSIFRVSRSLVAAVSCAVVVLLSACGGDDRTVTVEHGPVPPPAYVDLGDEGPSAGDQRVFHFQGTSGNTPVTMDWLMTTTATDSPEAGVESRITTGVFLFDGLDDSLILQGTGWYPGQDATFEVSATLVRAIIGGTGDYEGASGWVESTRRADDTWSHVFHID